MTNENFNPAEKHAADFERAKFRRSVRKLHQEGSKMSPSEYEAFFFTEILGPICKRLEDLYGHQIDEIQDIKQELLGIKAFMFSVIQNQAFAHYKQVYKPIVDKRLEEIATPKEEQKTLFELDEFSTAPIKPEEPDYSVVYRSSSTQLRGVTEKNNGYVANIWSDRLIRPGRKHGQQSLGTYKDPIFPAFVRDAAALDLHGEKAKLNFPVLCEDEDDE